MSTTPTKYGWITIEEGCELPNDMMCYVAYWREEEQEINHGFANYFKSINSFHNSFYRLNVIAWYKIPPYNPEPIVNPHESTEGC